ncbi:MAG TPA: hypothetical protein ENK57_19515 [Polyangiaceae bacterium]|nr:hypothetical protein [Polyangiaceae bacterium]
MSLSTIDYTVSADLFTGIDQTGLQHENSARAFQIELRKQLRDEFPKANIFLKWNPNRTGAADVFTLPEGEAPQKRVLAIADALHADRSRWLRYDAGSPAKA